MKDNLNDIELLDDFELPVFVLQSLKGTYVNKTFGRTKFIRKSCISDYMSLYESGIEAFYNGHRDLKAQGILKLTELKISNEKDKQFVSDYLKENNICVINTDKGYVKSIYCGVYNPHVQFTELLADSVLLKKDILKRNEKEISCLLVGDNNVKEFSFDFI